MNCFILLYLVFIFDESFLWVVSGRTHNGGVVGLADQHDPMGRMLHFLYNNRRDKSRRQFNNIEDLRKIFVNLEDTLVQHTEQWKKNPSEDVNSMMQFISHNEVLRTDMQKIQRSIHKSHHGKFQRRMKKFLAALSNKINDKRQKQVKWTAETLNSGVDITSETGNVLRSLKELAPTTNLSHNKVMENWIGKHFRKPHHTSDEDSDRISTQDLQVLRSVKLALDQSTQDREIQNDLKQREIGAALLKGVLEERSMCNSSSVEVSEELRRICMEEEKKWEMKLTQETQRLLEKLKPAEAYVIPDMGELNSHLPQVKEMKALQTTRKIQKMMERRKKEKNKKLAKWSGEKWNAFTSHKLIQRKKDMLSRRNKKNLIKIRRKAFELQLASEEAEWLAIDKNARMKIRSLEKARQKLKE